MGLKFKLVATAFLFAGTVVLSGQSRSDVAGVLSSADSVRLHNAEDTLALLAFAVVNDSVEQQRFGACRALIIDLVRNLKIKNSYRYKFERLQSISILTPPDSSFRIFTWQLFVNDSTYHYYGAIQMNRHDLELYPMIDRSMDTQTNPVYEQLPADHWYGALYYNIRQFDTKEGRKYLLLGYDGFEFFTKRKVIDVLAFRNDGKPIFGAPVFDRGKGKNTEPEMRILFEYSAEAKVRVNWDDLYGMVLFDHLIDMPSPFGHGITSVPDGSYDGLKLEKDKWKFVDSVFKDDVKTKEAPRPEPILDDRNDTNIIGKPRKKNDE